MLIKKKILLASGLSDWIVKQRREWLQHLQIMLYEANVDIKKYLWILFS